MSCFLRQLPDGARFLLCRTRQKYRLVRRDHVKPVLRACADVHQVIVS